MKKIVGMLILIFGIIIFTGCGNKKDLTDYITVSFEGVNGYGKADYSVDEERLIEDLYHVDSAVEPSDAKIVDEIRNMIDSYEISIDKNTNLSNGDEIILTTIIDENKSKKLKLNTSEKIKVEKLSTAKKLTDNDIEKHVSVKFVGFNEWGGTSITNNLNEPLHSLDFIVKNEGTLKNGDNVVVELTKDSKDTLNSVGYVLSGKGEFSVKVSGLQETAKKVSDIANLNEIKRMINEGITTEYSDSSETRYEIVENTLMYRQFYKKEGKKDTEIYSEGESGNGKMIGVYSIKKINTGIVIMGKREEHFIAIFGFEDILLNNNMEADVNKMRKTDDYYDDTYSMESVLKLMESYGFEQVN